MVADPAKGDPKGYAAAEPTANGVSMLVPIEDVGSLKGGRCGSGDEVLPTGRPGKSLNTDILVNSVLIISSAPLTDVRTLK